MPNTVKKYDTQIIFNVSSKMKQQITNKVSNLDQSLSDYIRDLIRKDLEN